jgi:chromosome segregation ATPase
MRLPPVLVLALACAGCVVPQQKYDALNSEKLLIEAKCADVTREKEKLAAEKASLDAAIARGERDVAKFEQRVKDLRESNIELMREVCESRKRIAEYEKKSGELGAAHARAAEDKKSLERKCERIENERVTVQRQYRALLDQHNQLQRRLAEEEQGRAAASAPPPAPAAPARGKKGAAQGGQGLDVSGTDG